MSPEVCSVLVGHATGVDLSVLKAIDEPLARVLAGCRGRLVLNGVGQISDQCAAILAECPGDLALSGLSELRSASLAKKLASQQSPTVLPRVTSLPLAVADALGAARSMPVLGDLEALESRLLARRLANRNGDDLTFSALRGLSPEAAAGLAEFPCDLRLPALTSLARGSSGRSRDRQGSNDAARGPGCPFEKPRHSRSFRAPNLGATGTPGSASGDPHPRGHART